MRPSQPSSSSTVNSTMGSVALGAGECLTAAGPSESVRLLDRSRGPRRLVEGYAHMLRIPDEVVIGREDGHPPGCSSRADQEGGVRALDPGSSTCVVELSGRFMIVPTQRQIIERAKLLP